MRVDQGYWDALSARDAAAALQAVKRLQREGMTSAEIIGDVVAPAQRRIGDLWLDALWTVEDEQVATAINEGLVHWLGSFTLPPGEDRPLVIVSCVEGDSHAMPALVVAELMVAAGYRVGFLGSDPDPDVLLRQILTTRPRAVLLSVSLTSALARPKPDLLHLRSLGIPVVVGGQAFGHDERRALAIGATAYAETPQAALDLLATLPARLAWTEPPPATPGDGEAAWIERERDRITAYVVTAVRRSLSVDDALPSWWDELAQQVDHLVGCLSAALATGDETIVLEAHAWLAQLMARRGAVAGVVREVWESLAEPLRGHPLARQLVAAAATYADPPPARDQRTAGRALVP